MISHEKCWTQSLGSRVLLWPLGQVVVMKMRNWHTKQYAKIKWWIVLLKATENHNCGKLSWVSQESNENLHKLKRRQKADRIYFFHCSAKFKLGILYCNVTTQTLQLDRELTCVRWQYVPEFNRRWRGEDRALIGRYIVEMIQRFGNRFMRVYLFIYRSSVRHSFDARKPVSVSSGEIATVIITWW